MVSKVTRISKRARTEPPPAGECMVTVIASWKLVNVKREIAPPFALGTTASRSLAASGSHPLTKNLERGEDNNADRRLPNFG